MSLSASQNSSLLSKLYRKVLYPGYQRSPDLLYRLIDTYLYRNDTPLGGVGYYREYLNWRRHIARPESLSLELPDKLSVTLLSFNRAKNMRLIVRGFLNLPFVETVVVSNNNPAVRIEKWIRFKDPRLRLINQANRTAPGIRFEIARQLPGKYFLSIDDDVFLYAHQVQLLAQALMSDPVSPYGLQGENRERPASPASNLENASNGWTSGLSGFSGEVDVINRVYAFTREHLEEMYRLARLLKLEVRELANGEDLLLSFSGQTKPRIIAAGKIFGCLSENRSGIATWATREHFFTERARLFDRLRAVKPCHPSK